jgi:glycogen debranching enzyme
VNADFRDVFEVRGVTREYRGSVTGPRESGGQCVYVYTGLDGVTRQTTVHVLPLDLETSDGMHEVSLTVPAKTETEIELICCFQSEGRPEAPLASYAEVAGRAIDGLRSARRDACHVYTSNEQFNDWLHRSFADLHMLTTTTEVGKYPYAGIPWFSTPFGRDGIITAMQCLWNMPSLARGVLAFLAQTQATETDPAMESQPGKILHEMRHGEMVALNEVPFARYYGTVDATPLFVCLAGDYFERTADRRFLRSIWPNVVRALEWMEHYGDMDGDGYVEYNRSVHRGLVNQGWKDSNDAIFNEHGEDLEGPVALCEVQGYVFAARIAAARLARVMGDEALAIRMKREAAVLQQRFEGDFWCDELGVYALALDANKKPCRVRTSNAGHALFAGISARPRARRVVRALLEPGSYSGWGIRTLDESSVRFNPMSYHNGSIWPHDNALIAAGFARYGHKNAAVRVLTGLFDVSLFMPMHRLPELFCGLARQPEEGPALYPVACMPQAWASGAVFQLLQACLGMRFATGDGKEPPAIELHRPLLPRFLETVEIQGLRVGDSTVDVTLTRHEEDVGVNVRRRSGEVRLLVIK